METTLYVSDLDGTLLNNGSMISDTTAAMLQQLTDDGALITVATARTPASVVPLMAGTGLTLPYIVMTGAATFSPESMTYGDMRLMQPGDVDMAVEIMERGGVNPFVYGVDPDDSSMLRVWHREEMTPIEQDFYTQRCDMPLKRFQFTGSYNSRSVPLLFATAEASLLQPIASKLQQSNRYSVSLYPDIFNEGMMLMELFAPNVSKAAAIAAMAQRLKVERIVAFGDNLNDLPMLQMADLAVAVGNAHPLVKQAADIVIGPNYDDAVPRFIAHDLTLIENL